ncbi:MAG: alpha-mannosidase, partial [Actinomycetaceae bacterium]|nr:alpha-mannosidase [Actinomycetaceae bacterium]
MHDNREILMGRVERTVRERIIPAQFESVKPLSVSRWIVPAEGSVVGEPVSFEEAKAASFEPIAVGDAWGKPWETVWFRLEADVPQLDLGEDHLEIVFDLGWFDHSAGFQCEGLVRDEEGHIVKAINPRN